MSKQSSHDGRRFSIASGRGLQALSNVQSLKVHQDVNMLGILAGCVTESKYKILNERGQQLFYATEESGCCSRMCCCRKRGFEMSIVDNDLTEIISISRPLSCCRQSMLINAPPSDFVGFIQQECPPCSAKFVVLDRHHEEVYRITGQCCNSSRCRSAPFKILERGEEVGWISSKFRGYSEERFTDADMFGIQFPSSADVTMKAVLLSATFLIDYMYFEEANSNHEVIDRSPRR